jgi:hypothetical protein
MKFATRLEIEVIRTWQLPLPAAKQINMYDEDNGEGKPDEP